MTHLFRFLGEMLDAQSWRLVGGEAHHLTKVLRLDAGAQIEVTNGAGTWAVGTVLSTSPREVLVAAGPMQQAVTPRQRLSFAIGALRPGEVDEILPALTELGVTRIDVIQQEDVAKARLSAKVEERWQRILIAAMKQCKRATLPTLHLHDSVSDFVAAAALALPNARRLVLSGDAEHGIAAILLSESPREVVMVAGGEKGLSASESATLERAGYTPVRLGPFVLRAVTAAVAGAAVWAAHADPEALVSGAKP